MRKPMCVATLISLLLACAEPATAPFALPTTLGLPPALPGFPAEKHTGFFVATDGSAYSDGSEEHPWSLSTALAQPGIVKPGDTIWVHGGRYTGEFSSALSGTPDAPIVARAFPGERVVIDGRLNIDGHHAVYWGFEVMNSDPARETAIVGSDPTDLPRIRAAIFVGGPFNKVINFVVHDLSNGIFAGSPAEGLELYGSVFYNNGWAAPDRGHGHNVYLQNTGATKVVEDNVLFGSFSSGLQIYGTDAASLQNFLIEGNTIFNSGDPVADRFGHTFNIEQWGGAPGTMANTVYKKNSVYHRDGRETAARFNAPGEAAGANLEFSGNIVQGETSFNEMKHYVVQGNKFTSGRQQLAGQSVLVALRLPSGDDFSAHIWEGNRYAVPPVSTQDPFHVYDGTMTGYLFPTWRSATSYDQSGVFVDGSFSTPDVIVRPNRYEPGRAFITCWNWGRAGSLSVDLSPVLKPGDTFVIHHVFDLYGVPVLSGLYRGGTVSLPQPRLTPPTPIGYYSPPPMPTNEFNVFLVEKR